MSKKRGETDQQWMARIRASRTDRDTMMLHTRAVHCLARQTQRSESSQAAVEMAGFMAIFHPDFNEETTRLMIMDETAKSSTSRRA